MSKRAASYDPFRTNKVPKEEEKVDKLISLVENVAKAAAAVSTPYPYKEITDQYIRTVSLFKTTTRNSTEDRSI
jgi:hypothetical protein